MEPTPDKVRRVLADIHEELEASIGIEDVEAPLWEIVRQMRSWR